MQYRICPHRLIEEELHPLPLARNLSFFLFLFFSFLRIYIVYLYSHKYTKIYIYMILLYYIGYISQREKTMVRIIPMASSIKPSLSSLGFAGTARVGVPVASLHHSYRRIALFHLASGMCLLFHRMLCFLKINIYIYIYYSRNYCWFGIHFLPSEFVNQLYV